MSIRVANVRWLTTCGNAHSDLAGSLPLLSLLFAANYSASVQSLRSRLISLKSVPDSVAEKLHSVKAPILLWLLALCQAATILATWRLWQIRQSPPMLPALPLPEINLGVILLITLAGVFFRPRAALTIHTAAMIYAILIDQTRLQPELVSLLVLMWGSLWSRSPGWFSMRRLAQAHLISLWFYSGFNKLLSSGYRSSINFDTKPSVGVRNLILPLIEILVAVLVCIPRTRKVGASLACALHVVLLIVLLRGRQNSAIWAWNLGLAFAALAYFYSAKDSLVGSLRKSNRWIRVIALLILTFPLGFYIGLGDPYLAHNLYTNNTPAALWQHANGERENIQTSKNLNVPIPPEHRLFEQYFNLVCKPGDQLVIYDFRYWAALRGYSERVLPCR
jgi:hypothetical protein